MIVDIADHRGYGPAMVLATIPLERADLIVDADSSAPLELRHRTSLTLARWRIDPVLASDAVLCVDRLVTDLLQSAPAGQVGLGMAVFRDHVRVEVSAHGLTSASRLGGTGSSETPRPGTLAELDRVASRWGSMREPGSTTVWFDAFLHDTLGDHTPHDDRPAVRAHLTEDLARADDAEALGTMVTTALRRDLQAVFVGLALRTETELRYVAVAPLPGATVARWPSVPLDRPSPVTETCRTGSPVFADSVEAGEVLFPGLGIDMAEIGVGSFAHVPVVGGGATLGTLGAGWAAPDPDPRHRRSLLAAAAQTAVALELLTPTARRFPRTVMPATRVRPWDSYGAGPSLAAGGLELDLVTRSVRIDGRSSPVRLSGREFELLAHLVRDPDRVHSRDELLREVWGFGFETSSAVVDVTMSRLRRKIRVAELHTVSHEGYVFRTTPSAPNRAAWSAAAP